VVNNLRAFLPSTLLTAQRRPPLPRVLLKRACRLEPRPILLLVPPAVASMPKLAADAVRASSLFIALAILLPTSRSDATIAAFCCAKLQPNSTVRILFRISCALIISAATLAFGPAADSAKSSM
jgi:hypothetical protein